MIKSSTNHISLKTCYPSAVSQANGRAVDWIRANPDEAAQIANKVTKFKIEYCRKFIDEFQGWWTADGSLPQKGMKVFWEISIQAGDVTEVWPESRWLDPTFLKTQAIWRK